MAPRDSQQCDKEVAVLAKWPIRKKLLLGIGLLVVIVATLGLFTSSKAVNLVAQRHEIAVHQAQREMEQLRSLKYSELGLKTTPSASSDPKNPDYRVQSGNRFRVDTNPVLDEDLVLQAEVPGSAIDPGPDTFYAGTGTPVEADRVCRTSRSVTGPGRPAVAPRTLRSRPTVRPGWALPETEKSASSIRRSRTALVGSMSPISTLWPDSK